MTHSERYDGTDDLIEPQGVNAGPPADDQAADREGTSEGAAGGETAGARTVAGDTAAGDTAAGEQHGEGDERRRAGRPAVPDQIDLLDAAPDRRAGLPEQRPGYPGQQRSVDTS